MKRIKVMTILGTRPEIIRLSAVIAKLEKYSNHVLVHTGQNYDFELNQIFFDELGLQKPDHFLDADTSSLGNLLGSVIIKSEKVLLEEKPDAVLVLGDTNSAIALLMAKRMKIPTYHMEAGNRCFDANVPEEINRKLFDHLADFNLVYTEHARRHLIAEGLPHRQIYLTGSPMREVLENSLEKIDSSDALVQLDLKEKQYFIVSVHREENVDSKRNLKKVLTCLIKIYDRHKLPLIVSTHPRTRDRLNKLSVDIGDRDIRFLKPFGFFDYNKLQKLSKCAISDSGTISEESAILEFPAITIRNAIERPEAIDTGSIVITGLDADTVLSAIEIVIGERGAMSNSEIPIDYTVRNTSTRVCKLILGTARLANRWRNLEDFSRYNW